MEVVQSDRGGDITFHGPGQLVAYPVVRLNNHGLSVGGYVHGLEEVVIETLADFGVVRPPGPFRGRRLGRRRRGDLAKVCAIGVRIRRGVSLHGLALNVDTDLSYFNLIVPCGLAGRQVTSLRRLLGRRRPRPGPFASRSAPPRSDVYANRRPSRRTPGRRTPRGPARRETMSPP